MAGYDQVVVPTLTTAWWLAGMNEDIQRQVRMLGTTTDEEKLNRAQGYWEVNYQGSRDAMLYLPRSIQKQMNLIIAVIATLPMHRQGQGYTIKE